MGIIKILPESLANKIAAGEVVQRPESALKELLENSIDAQAKNIEVYLKRAGKTLIQVTDDGKGMSEDDMILCVQKHATSKISTPEDLDAIKTLGFRGEALSSISAVSQFEIRSKQHGDEIGTRLRVEEGGVFELEKGSFPEGTTVIVRNLFYNTPARRNFLKTDTTELKHCIDTFNRIALSYPDIAFRLFIDDSESLKYPAGNENERIIQVFGETLFNSLIPVKEETGYITLRGFIGKPSLLKKSKGDQFIYLNNRYVQNRQINHAVFTAYETVLVKGEYPFFLLFLKIDPAHTDVNVHPSKLEVRFENEKDVYTFVLSVVKKGLGQFDLVPNMSFTSAPDTGSGERMKFNPSVASHRFDFSDRPVFAQPERKKEPLQPRITNEQIEAVFSSLNSVTNRTEIPEDAPHPFENPGPSAPQPQVRNAEHGDDSASFIIQLHNKYILSQIKSGLMIIDQHVAHERILYEKALRLFEANLPFSQPLLFPKTIQVNPAVLLLIRENYDLLVKLGFELKFFGKDTIIIEGVPQDLRQGDEEAVLLEMIDEFILNEREKKISDTRDNMAKSYSCKTAIKAGDKLSEAEMRILIDQLFATSMPYVCPHGRPVVIKIGLDEFDKRFGRT